MLEKVPEELAAVLAEHDQSHLCEWWDDLTGEQRDALVHQLHELEFGLVSRLVEEKLGNQNLVKADQRAERAAPPSRLERLSHEHDGNWSIAHRAGEELLREGRVAALVVAGGQGTRLGFDQPKGMYPIGPLSEKTLFQMHFEQLEALSTKYGMNIPYFIMTSDATDAETKSFLESNDYFGYSFHDVYIFKQGSLPAVDADGKILLADKGRVATSPDGHGGMLNALKRAGLIEIMHERGIEHIFYHQVDNPTVLMCDPHFLGLHARSQSELSTKVVAKTGPAEKMGVVVDVDGDTQIIEYSDLTEDQQHAVDANGDLLLWAGNTAIHAFRTSLLERLTDGDASLPYHVAHKKVSYLGDSGDVVAPDEPNAFKFEQFIFDALPEASNALVVEADRSREFNPVKNADGADSPETARAAILAAGRSVCEEAGLAVSHDARVEVSPLCGTTAADVKAHLHSGQPISEDLYLVPEEAS